MSAIQKKAFNILLAAAFAAPACSYAQTPSTAALRAQGSLFLNVVTDDYGSRMGMDYSLRWDFSDLSGLNPFSLKGYRRLNPFSGWDLFENTRWRVYGLSVNPWKVVVSRGRPDLSGGSPAAEGGEGGTGAGTSAAGRAAGRRVWRLSLSPLLQDLEETLDEDLRRALLDVSLSGAAGEWRAVPREGKKAFLQDVLSLQVWELPLLDRPGGGIRYIAR